MRVAVTGANGYIGSALCKYFFNFGYTVVAIVRKPTSKLPIGVKQLILDDFTKLDVSTLDKAFEQLKDFDALIHAAGIAHSYRKNSKILSRVQEINIQATEIFSQVAEKVCVRRFIFLSSVGVNGNICSNSVSEIDKVNPHNIYTQSKYEAECQLLSLSKSSSMEVIIVRPPMVYSLDAPGNFAKLIRLVKLGLPLPFKHLENQRSVIALDNLLDFLNLCANKDKTPLAKNQIFFVADKHLLSTKEIAEKIAKTMGLKLRMMYISPKVIFWILNLLGKEKLYVSLFESMIVDTSKARSLLGWEPSIDMDQQLKKRN